MGERESEDHLRLISEQSESEIEAHQAVLSATHAAIDLLSNLMRVLRGAGKPSEIIHQAASLVAAFDKFYEIRRRYPGEEVANKIRESFWYDECSAQEWSIGIDQMIRGALQMAASRLVGQRTQEKAGQHELIGGLTVIEGIRAANRREWQRDP